MRSIKEFKDIVNQSTIMFSFAFGKKKPIEVLFPEGLSKYLNEDENIIKKEVSSRLEKYFIERFKKKKLPVLFKKYIDSIKKEELDAKDFVLFDELLNSLNYDLTFKDAAVITNHEKVNKFLTNDISKDILEENNFIEKLYEFLEITNQEEDESKEEQSIIITDTTDIYKLYNNECARYKLLTYEEERIYLKRYLETKDPEAFDILVGSNQGLVKKVAYAYINRGLSYLDLIQEGNLGLIRAINDFDLNLGWKLSTYAIWWIRQAITKSLADKARTIRVPLRVNELLNKLKRIEKELGDSLGREPFNDEIVEKWNLEVKDEKQEMTIEKLESLKRTRILVDQTSSLNKEVNDDSGTAKDNSELAEFVEDQTAEDPEEYSEKADLKRRILKAIDEMRFFSSIENTERARIIIRMRYGLFNEDIKYILRMKGLSDKPREMTLKEVGKVFEVSPERIRQIEERVIKKLKIRLKAYENDEKYQKSLEKKKDNQ